MSEVKTDKISSVSTNGDITLDPDGTGAVVVDAPIKLDGNYPTGSGNVALGDTALDTVESGGTNNTAIGSAALTANTTADNNTAVGYNALAANTTGVLNTAVGKSALQSATTASDNTAVGGGALEDNTTGSNNTAVGRTALANSTTGYSNTAVGHNAGDALTTAANCTIRGQDAGGAMTTGDKNTFFGQQAGSLVSTGSKHTFVGRYNGNQSNLDLRTATNNIVLSDGDSKVGLRISGSKCVVLPGHGSDNSGGVVASASLNVYKTGATTRVIHSENKQNTSGAENYRSFLGSNCNNTSSYHFIASISGGGDKLYMYGNGNIQNTNNSYGGLSDSKLKENISDATSQWDDIKAVQVKKYSWIADDLDAANQIGVIAQDLEASGMGGLVETTDDKDEDGALTGTQTKGVKYSVLYMKAIKALQEAMERIETLETENTTQATQIADLITRVTALEDA